MPSLTWPEVSLARVIELVGPAFAIAMLGAIESLLSAVVADGMAGTRHDSNQELIGQGVANLVVPLFGALPPQVPLPGQRPTSAMALPGRWPASSMR